MRRRAWTQSLAGLLAAGWLCTVHADSLEPLTGPGPMPPAPWRVLGLPGTDKAITRFLVENAAGRRALRVEALDSYGNVAHPLHGQRGLHHLAWLWRVDLLNQASDLRVRAGDDVMLRVCVLFDMPREKVPLIERPLLSLAGLYSGELLPTATVCYVWDHRLAAGTALDNAYTRRLRYLVLESGAAAEGEWRAEARDVGADFLRLFGDESHEVPPVTAIMIGADADNTHGHSIAHVSALVFTP